MTLIRSGFLHSSKVNNLKTVGSGIRIKLEFSPAALGAIRQRNGEYPPTIKITENQIETELLKHFGFNVSNPADFARIKELLGTSDSPFAKLVTTGTFVAVYNNHAGKYEAVDSVNKELYAELQGKTAEVKQQIKTEKEQSALTNQINPNDLIAAKNGITNDRQIELKNKLQQNDNSSSVSAPNEAKQSVRRITDTIAAVTGTTDWENAGVIGSQFNRLGVSTLRLTGKAMELSNSFNEQINGAIRYVAPHSVDELLNKSDAMNRETAKELQQASSAVTSEDDYVDAIAKEQGREISVTEDLANKAMYFPEGIPNALDSAVRGISKTTTAHIRTRSGKWQAAFFRSAMCGIFQPMAKGYGTAKRERGSNWERRHSGRSRSSAMPVRF